MRLALAPVRKVARGVLVLAAAALLLPASPVAGADPEDDGAPPGMVAFLLAAGPACPPGWAPAAEARGRLIVGVTAPIAVGLPVGVPLGDQEDRRHRHGYSGQVSLSHKGLAAADGSNRQGARAGALAVSGQSTEATTGLPFIQLLACEK